MCYKGFLFRGLISCKFVLQTSFCCLLGEMSKIYTFIRPKPEYRAMNVGIYGSTRP
jgi:hypothetical protein